MKECKRCKLPKELSEFSLHSGFKDGHNSVCKTCKQKEGRDYYDENSDKILSKQKKTRRREVVRQYGITESDYDEMFYNQNGLCKICGKSQSRRPLAIDHDHSNGKVRGLLCDNCNWMIGLAHDDIDVLKSAIQYLEG